MTTTVAIATNAGHSSTTSSILDIPLTHIRESKTNPRRQFDETELAELAANIRQHGVLQPVLVWPSPDAEPGTYELVAGARRFRASRIAGRETIPASVRKLTDTECLELQLIENLQRADVHELDEARGYATLMQMQPETYTVETLAVKIGRSEKYVYARLRLNPAKGRSACHRLPHGNRKRRNPTFSMKDSIVALPRKPNARIPAPPSSSTAHKQEL